MSATQTTDTTAQVCDLCGSGEYRVLSRKGRHGMPLTTVVCGGCGLVYTNPRPTEAENAEFYKRSYWGSYKNQSAPDERFFRRRLPKIRSMLGRLKPHLKPGCSVLEVGSGVGALLSCVSAELNGSSRVVGIEPHEGHARFARSEKRLDVRNGLLEEIAPDLGAESFDLAVMNHVLEHTVSPTSVFETLDGLLKPGGVLVVEVPNIEAPGARLSHFLHIAHHFNFSPNTLRRLALKTGFRVRSIEALDGDLPGTRLFGEFEKAAEGREEGNLNAIRDDAEERIASLHAYNRWYWLTAASLRKKLTHWRRQRGQPDS